MSDSSMCFTPTGLARKNAPGVFVVVPNERRATRRDAEAGPSRRIAPEMEPYGVAALGKGTTIVRRLRLPGSASGSNATGEMLDDRP
ncbi:hypothetical protein GCM10017624_24350 [Azotobacter vinelandii]|nr:hypothetical protein GCM10017624_24350 [Azotobacter vinelandii]